MPLISLSFPSPLHTHCLLQSVRRLQLARKERENAARKDRLKHLAMRVQQWSYLFSSAPASDGNSAENSEFPPPPPTRINVTATDPRTLEIKWSPPRGIVSVEKIRYRVGAKDTSSQSIFGDFDAVTLTEKGHCVAKLVNLKPGCSYVVQVRGGSAVFFCDTGGSY